jgi:UDP-N-acetylmuramoyl-tripeptide--D-alanyl-D-alanine ligase
MGWSRAAILEATGGKLRRAGARSSFGEVVTDSNKAKIGSVFVALKGERLDGHRFIADAVRRGAGCVVVHRVPRSREVGGAAVVEVGDTLRALGDLAHFRRERFAPTVLAITGSNGKTTTKEMLAAILEESFLQSQPLRGKVLKTEGNFNNLVGLPLTLLRLRKQDRVAVVELGTNHPGEIQRLSEIADPDFAIITSVAAAHLEGLSSLAGVAREKGALYRNLRPGGAIAVNLDDPWVRRLGMKFKGRKFTYGKGGWLRAENLRMRDAKGVEFTLRMGARRGKLRLHYLGQHNVANALGAAALALGLGASLAAVRRGLDKAKPYAMRMQVDDWRGVGIINDAYNANPASMRAALRTLGEIFCRGKKIAVLGDMFELGRQSRREHQELGRTVAKAKIHQLYLLGQRADEVRQGALAAGMGSENIFIGKSHGDLAKRLRAQSRTGDWLLLKGSRGMKMEKILGELRGGEA